MVAFDQRMYSNPDVELWLTLDDADAKTVRTEDDGDQLAYKIVGGWIDKKSDDAFLIHIEYPGFSGDWDTDDMPQGSLDISSSLLKDVYWDDIIFRAARKVPKPRSPGSVSAGTPDGIGTSENSTSAVTGSFTPSNSLIMLAVGFNDATPGTTTITDSFSDTITWTLVKRQVQNIRCVVEIWEGRGWVSGAGTVTATNTVTLDSLHIFADTFGGHDTSDPIPENNGAGNALSTLSVTLIDIGSGNRSYGAVNSRGGTGVTQGANENELQDSGVGNSNTQSQYGNLGFDTDVNWSDLATGRNAGAAAEIAEAVIVDSGGEFPIGEPQVTTRQRVVSY